MRKFRLGDAVCDLDTREITLAGTGRRMEPKAAEVLGALAAAGLSMVGRAELLDRCWTAGEGSDEALTQAIAQLRRLLHDTPQSPRYIQTVPRAGYRLLLECKPVSPEVAADLRARALSRRRFGRPAIAAACGVPLAVLSLGAAIALLPLHAAGLHPIRHFVRHQILHLG